ncbi:hypothetical protein ACG9XR_07955 [Acinetobacter guillouiae]|uniref:hypothetical protein n=1 Tax=Acinetobacter guillouiae TaxID=106649 RepID=UPI0028D14DE9|nr:hypothetical protein [Acinetobacter guillouiae]
MKLRILLLLSFSPEIYANQIDHCEIIAESAGMIMQLRQFGVDLNTAFNLKGELSNNAKNLEVIIADAESKPVYATNLGKQKVEEEFAAEWKKLCLESVEFLNDAVDQT